jgi:hypothetical protein
VEPVTAYLELGLRLGRHIDGLVDGYFGPTEIFARIEAESLRSPGDLAADATAIRGHLEELEPQRASWVGAQLAGMETVARRLAGENIAYADEVERCYGVRPQRILEDVFAAAHQKLDELLPGSAPLAERYAAWREGNALHGDQLRLVVSALARDLRERTAAALGLPDGEEVDFDYVREEPWAAYNYYEGGLRSRIAVNTDLPLPAVRAVELVAHETYPGHHTEHVWKEQGLVRDRGYLEESLLMIGAPGALISEGIAEVGSQVLLGDELDDIAEAHLADAGARYDAGHARAVKAAAHDLGDVAGNTALLLHEDGASEDEAAAYLRRWALATEKRARQTVSFLTDPVWRSYITTYSDGERLVGRWVDGDLERFRRLLTEQLSPADLLQETGGRM